MESTEKKKWDLEQSEISDCCNDKEAFGILYQEAKNANLQNEDNHINS